MLTARALASGLTDVNTASLQVSTLNVTANPAKSRGTGAAGVPVYVGRLRWGDHTVEPYCTSLRSDSTNACGGDDTEVAAELIAGAEAKHTRVETATSQQESVKDDEDVGGSTCSDDAAVNGYGHRGKRKRRRTNVPGDPSSADPKVPAAEAFVWPSPPGRHGVQLIVASDIIVEDAAIPAVWSTVDHFLSDERGAIFVMTCIERPTLLLKKGVVSEERIDTTLKSFVEASAKYGFEAGEAQPTAVVGDTGAADEVRTFVFARADCER